MDLFKASDAAPVPPADDEPVSSRQEGIFLPEPANTDQNLAPEIAAESRDVWFDPRPLRRTPASGQGLRKPAATLRRRHISGVSL